jgi:hypothetical protein
MRMNSPTTGLRCREIGEADIDAVVALLIQGFPERGGRFWQAAFEQLHRHEPPTGSPKYGYLLESGGNVVGALLLIFSRVPHGDALIVRCNVSSWYVEPAFRAYAPMLVSRAIRNKDISYLNVSPAPHTRAIIEAQGFSRYASGTFVSMPALKGLTAAPKARVFDASCQLEVDFTLRDQQILATHASYGCISLWCVAGERAHPFVFRRRRLRGVIPVAHLIYCSEVTDFVHFAGPIGLKLASHGLALVSLDANARVPGLPGWFIDGRAPKYYRGPVTPRLGDLAYTEYAMLGI